MSVAVLTGGREQEGIYYQGITGMKADMSGARTTPKLLELQEDCLARDLSTAGTSSSDESSDDEFDPEALPSLACLESSLVPVDERHDEGSLCQLVGPGQQPGAEQQPGVDQQPGHDSDESTEEGSSQSGLDAQQSVSDCKADRKAHKKAVKEANRERRKHKMPKHVKKKRIAKSHKK